MRFPRAGALPHIAIDNYTIYCTISAMDSAQNVIGCGIESER